MVTKPKTTTKTKPKTKLSTKTKTKTTPKAKTKSTPKAKTKSTPKTKTNSTPKTSSRTKSKSTPKTTLQNKIKTNLIKAKDYIKNNKVTTARLLLAANSLYGLSQSAYGQAKIGQLKSKFLQTLRLSKNFTDKYQIVNQIGSGAFGQVYSGYIKNDEKTPIVVKIQQASSDIKEAFGISNDNNAIVNSSMTLTEHKAIKKIMGLKCEGLAKPIDFEYDNGKLKIVYKASLNTDLIDHELKTPDAKYMTILSLLNGVRCLHNNGIAHSDIKETNILVSNSAPYKVEIIDYGAACQKTLFGYCDRDMPYPGTELYMNPEFKRKIYSGNPLLELTGVSFDDTIKYDIWATGMCIYYILYEEQLITEVRQKYIPSFPDNKLGKFMKKMLSLDISDRETNINNLYNTWKNNYSVAELATDLAAGPIKAY